jgi:hypothetical protein
MKKSIEDRIQQVESKVKTLEMIEAMVDLYSRMLMSLGPEKHADAIDKTDTMLWTEMGKETFSEVSVMDIVMSTIALVSDILMKVNSKFESLSDLMQDVKAGKRTADIAKVSAALKLLMASPNKLLESNPDVRSALTETLTSGGKLLAAKLTAESEMATKLKKEKLLPFFDAMATAEAGSTVVKQYISDMEHKKAQLEILKNGRESGSKSETGSGV